MATILNLVQGSTEWHEHRKQYRNASETPAVLGVSPWVTPYQLWLQRTGRVPPQVTAPMAHGTQLEPLAREAYEQLTGLLVEPLVLADGEYSASLDGLTLDQQILLEIKCPYKGRASELWHGVQQGEIPVHYRWQLQHQLMVSGAELAHLYVYEGQDGLLLEVNPTPGDWMQIRDAWDVFMHFVRDDAPPPLTDRDTLIRSDDDWLAAALAFANAKSKAEEIAAALDDAKNRLIVMTSHASEKGGGVAVTRYWKQGAVDYKKIPEICGIDLDKYRAPSREEVRVSTIKLDRS